MINTYISISKLSENKKDILYAIFFGILSIVFAKIEFSIPGFDGRVSNFREVPLLIAVLYIRNPLYLIVLSLLTAIYTSPGIPNLLNFFIHLISLYGAYSLYNYLAKNFTAIIPKTTGWVIMVSIYFSFLIIPSYIIFGYIVGYLDELNFVENYRSIFNLLTIEWITTLLVTSLFLMQFEIREALINHKQNLETIVEDRTEELAFVNKTLINLNANLDEMVEQRSQTIEKQLQMLVKYAHMNSHEVRAPLARILGLLYIIDQDDQADDRVMLDNQLMEASQELDEVVKRMNRLLEKEVFVNRK